MTLGVLPEQGGSMANLAASGQDRRFINQYFTRYAKAFDRVYYFSYSAEQVTLPARCQVVPNRARLHRWLYALMLPILHARYFRRCDVVRIMQLTGEVPALIAKVLYGVPFAATYGYRYAANARADGAGWARGALFAVRTWVVLHLADRIIVTNHEIRDEVIRRIAADRVVFLPNGVDVSEFAPSPSPEPAPTPVPTLLYVGRLAPVKNLGLLLEGVARLNRNVTVRMIGDGPLKGDLMRQARQSGVRLELPGVVSHHLLPDELRRATLFVLTSRREGNPKALLEAMSCGSACVATAAPGVTGLLEHERTGLLCAPDAASLAAALGHALDDPELRATLGANARARIAADFNIATILEREIAMLQELGRPRSARKN